MLETHAFTAAGKDRTYLQFVPASPENIILVFHGNGGTADGFAKKYVLEKYCSRSVVIYMEGIPGIGGGFDPKGLKNGWQRKKGDGEDRDLFAIDELVGILKKDFPKLKDRIYAMGHSNGGRFTYLLWSERPDAFKGFIINAHQGVDLLEAGLQPKSAMIITGKQDRVVNHVNQLKSAELIKQLIQFNHTQPVNDELTIYSNTKTKLHLNHFIHPGGHDVPKPALPFVANFIYS